MHLISRDVVSVILCTFFPSEKLMLCCRVIVQVFFIFYSTNDICSCHPVLCSLPFCSRPTVLGISNPMFLSERLSQAVWISLPVSMQIIWVQAHFAGTYLLFCPSSLCHDGFHGRGPRHLTWKAAVPCWLKQKSS